MKQIYYAVVAVFLTFTANILTAQEYAAEAIFVNGGSYGSTGSTEVVSLDLATGETTVFDKPGTSSVQAVLIEGDKAYVAVDDSLIVYDLTTKTRIVAINHKEDASSTDGVSHGLTLSADGTKLYFTKQYPADSEYVDVFDATTLEFETTILGIGGEAADMIIVGDSAYVAVPGGYTDTVGQIAVIDLTADTVVRVQNLGSTAKSMANICYYDGLIYGIVPRSYSSDYTSILPGRILIYDPVADTTATVEQSTIGSLSAYDSSPNYFGMIGDKIYVKDQESIGVYDISEGSYETVITGLSDLQAAYVDSVANEIVIICGTYATSNGKGYVYDLETGKELFSFSGVNYSPEQLKLYYKESATVEAPVLATALGTKTVSVNAEADTVILSNYFTHSDIESVEFIAQTTSDLISVEVSGDTLFVTYDANVYGDAEVSVLASYKGQRTSDILSIEIEANLYAAEAIFVNGGSYGSTGSTEVVSLDLATGETTVFDKPGTSSVQAVLIEGDKAYVAVDDSLIVYDLTTKTRIVAVNHKLDYPSNDGLGKSLSIFGDKLFFSKQSPATKDFVDVIDATTLEFSDSIVNIGGQAAQIVQIGDSLYVATPSVNSYTEGAIAVISLTDTTVSRIISLGTDASGMMNICEYDGKIYGIVPRTYSGAAGRIIEYDPATNTTNVSADFATLGSATGYDSSPNYFGMINDSIYVKNSTSIAIYDISEGTLTDVITGVDDIQTAVIDENNMEIVVIGGDYYSAAGTGKVFDLETGELLFSFDGVGMSPEQMGMYYKEYATAEAPVWAAISDTVTAEEDAGQDTVILSSYFTHAEIESVGFIAQTSSDLISIEVVADTLFFSYDDDVTGTAAVGLIATYKGQRTLDTLIIEITLVDDAVELTNPLTDITVDEDAADSIISLTDVATDIDGDAITYSVLANTNEGTVTASVSGEELTLAFTADSSGVAELVIQAEANGTSVTDTVLVTVNPVNDAPVLAGELADITVEENAADTTISLTGLVTDVDGDAVTYSVSVPDGAILTATVTGEELTLSYAPDVSGTVTVTVTGEANGETVSDEFTVTITPASGISETTVSYSVYPNPCVDVVNVTTEGTVDNIVILSQQGKVVARSSNTTEVDISNLASGMYFVQIEIDGTVFVSQLIKQ